MALDWVHGNTITDEAIEVQDGVCGEGTAIHVISKVEHDRVTDGFLLDSDALEGL